MWNNSATFMRGERNDSGEIMGSWESLIWRKDKKGIIQHYNAAYCCVYLCNFFVSLSGPFYAWTTFMQSFCLARALTSCFNLPNEQFGQNYSTLATKCWMFKYKTCSPTQLFISIQICHFIILFFFLQLWNYVMRKNMLVMNDLWEILTSTSALVLTILIRLAEVWSHTRNLKSIQHFVKRQILTYFDIISHNFELDHLFSTIFIFEIFLPNHMQEMVNLVNWFSNCWGGGIPMDE